MTRRPLLLPVIAILAVACGSPAASPTTGTLVIRAAYEEPPPNEPISIGGYGFFATVGELTEQEIPFDETLSVILPPGTHDLTVVTRMANDAIVCVEAGECEREFFDVTAECEDSVEVVAGAVVEVTYRAIGGQHCEIVVAT